MKAPVENGVNPSAVKRRDNKAGSSKGSVDIYISADIESDGPIPGPFSMLSFALVYAGTFNGRQFERPRDYERIFYRELKPISDTFDPGALVVNGLDRGSLCLEGEEPTQAMTEATEWVDSIAANGRPVLVPYPLSFDWAWLYWYFIRFSAKGSPFNHTQCFDIKTAFAVKAAIPIVEAGRSRILPSLNSRRAHTHNAVDDAVEQAEIFANLFEWKGVCGRTS